MSYILEALSGSVQASALDLSQNGIATLEFQDQHRRLYHVSTLMVGRLGDLWEWIVLNHQQKKAKKKRKEIFARRKKNSEKKERKDKAGRKRGKSLK